MPIVRRSLALLRLGSKSLVIPYISFAHSQLFIGSSSWCQCSLKLLVGVKALKWRE